MSNIIHTQTLLNNVNATTVSEPVLVDDAEDVLLEVTGTNSSSATIEVFGSIEEGLPNFSSASTLTNRHTKLQVKDLSNGASIDGATGIAFTGNTTRLYEVNTNAMRWIGVKATMTAGNITVRSRGYSSK